MHAHLEKQRREVMKWLGLLGHGYDPNRGSPGRGGPHPNWWGDDTGLAHEARVLAIALKGSLPHGSPDIPKEAIHDAFAGAVLGALATLATGNPDLVAVGALAGVGIGLAVGYNKANPHVPGSMPAPDDPSGGGGVGGPHASEEMPSPDDPDGGGVGGPRGRLRRVDLYFPDPAEGTGGGNPHSFHEYPNPDDTGSPIGPRS